jgi:hypothetical protein
MMQMASARSEAFFAIAYDAEGKRWRLAFMQLWTAVATRYSAVHALNVVTHIQRDCSNGNQCVSRNKKDAPHFHLEELAQKVIDAIVIGKDFRILNEVSVEHISITENLSTKCTRRGRIISIE